MGLLVKGGAGDTSSLPGPGYVRLNFSRVEVNFFLCVLSVNLAFFTCLNTVWYLVQLSGKVPFYLIFIAPRGFSLCPPLLLLTSLPLPLLPLPQNHHYSIIILQIIKYICVVLSFSFDLMPVIHYFKFVLFAIDITV